MYIELDYPYDLGQVIYQLNPNGEISEWKIVRMLTSYREDSKRGVTENVPKFAVIPKWKWDTYDNQPQYEITTYQGKWCKIEELEKQFFTSKKAIVKRLMDSI